MLNPCESKLHLQRPISAPSAPGGEDANQTRHAVCYYYYYPFCRIVNILGCALHPTLPFRAD